MHHDAPRFDWTSMLLFGSTATAAAVLWRRSRAKLHQPRGSLRHDVVPHHKQAILELRKRHTSKALSISYENSDPLFIFKAHGVYLYDEHNQAYLDTRNNVAHVGHCHVTVAQAVADQVRTLNTNTRYLHHNMALLAQRLAATLPDPLHVVFFCNSGSEANDLALRLARAATGGGGRRTHMLVLDRAYHGHTLATLQVSPYKYERGTESLLSTSHNVTKLPCPDLYRGTFQDPATAGARYAELVHTACQEHAGILCGMILESGMSVAGVVLPPPGYLPAVQSAVHKFGGVLIVDEVQTGLGRLGAAPHFWAFQLDTDVVVPDIVTIGKPFGNGMPLAAVVTTPAVAAQFEACGVEYFNTFGGNPVSTAAGLAVLNVLEREKLPERAARVGAYMKAKLQSLQNRVQLIGDVRGQGLFLGVEFVRDRATKEPAAAETSYICSQLKEKHFILTSIDGPHDNVIVIKPPLVFSRDNVDHFVSCLDHVALVDLPAARQNGELAAFGHTPT